MRAQMIVFVSLVSAVTITFAAIPEADIVFGQVYGSAGFLNIDPSGTMVDAPTTVIAFTAKDGHRTLMLTGGTGDFVALLQPGRYCISAYTRAGKALQLAKSQVKCVDVQAGKDTRLDVMILSARR